MKSRAYGCGNGCFDKNVVNLQTVMSRINDGIGNISAVVEENAQGVSRATENVSELAASIANIKEHAVENVESSKQLMNEINHFQKYRNCIRR